MFNYKSELNKIVYQAELASIENQFLSFYNSTNENDWADLFADGLYIHTTVQFLIEDHWIQNKASNSNLHFDQFIQKYFEMELKPIPYLHSFFKSSNFYGLQIALKATTHAKELMVLHIKSKSYGFKSVFLQACLKRISELIDYEFQLNSSEKKLTDEATLSLYRTYDILDEIFELNYIQNEVSRIDQTERLYENAGAGVQSSYASILLAFRYLNLSRGSRFIDLGSGYGRIGLILGCLRPDVQFTGYEFVKERVDLANAVSARFQLSSHVQFLTQDLSRPDFKIPTAETYYIFDSFSDSSYTIIMEQLKKMAQHQSITVVTKGNAKLWLKNQFWTEPQEFNGSNICFFRSKSIQQIT